MRSEGSDLTIDVNPLNQLQFRLETQNQGAIAYDFMMIFNELKFNEMK